ncbi:Cyclic di-GMP phosphodiesterase response regulator RpfG [Planctomycetes bacterium Pan216]|uniref:Cyclic di-GMP phosphodiesterase response regulator RpfG n=1 Tax=Kolteria novifilia TaxID=2527975 RepID=A0A518B9R2_9BACT|nr:Cyclic di-GMP phosphodiesterase response regulator RpfG [Planctomycetes bacterium Pan216]
MNHPLTSPLSTPLTAQPVSPAGSSRTFSVMALPLGYEAQHVFQSRGGSVLLPAGQRVTPRFLWMLQQSQIGFVELTDLEAGFLAERGVNTSARPPRVPAPQGARTDAARTIERDLVKPHALSVVRAGPPFKDRFRDLRGQPYDEETRTSLSEHDARSERQLRDIFASMKETPEQGASDPIDVGPFGEIILGYMDHLRADADLVHASALIGDRQDYLVRHSLQLATLAMGIASEIGYDARNVMLVGLAGLLHDVGMLQVPPEVRGADRQLTDDEFDLVTRHVEHTAAILARAHGLPHVVRLAAYQVHERRNGKGYPSGCHGGQIHPYSQILGVADTYLALVTGRPHQLPVLPYRALETMLDLTRDGAFEPKLVQALLRVLSLFPLGSDVLLSNQAVARVVRSNGIDYTLPIVVLTHGPDGEVLMDGPQIDLTQERSLQVIQAVAPALLSGETDERRENGAV